MNLLKEAETETAIIEISAEDLTVIRIVKNRENNMKTFKFPVLVQAILCFLLFSCVRNDAVVDTHQPIPKHHWSYLNKVQVPFQITDTTLRYNLYINLRHTSNYKYSNIFFLIHMISPGGKKTVERKEFTLALPDGEWLGKGSGNVYSYQLPYKSSYKFSKPGKYVLVIEQNMRDNPLREVTDAGIRLEVAE